MLLDRLTGSARPIRVLVTLALSASIAGLAAAQFAAQEKAEMTIDLDRTAYLPGETATMIVTMTIEDGWHTNSHIPTYDYLIPTEIEVQAPEAWPPAEFEYPEGLIKSFAFADDPISVYETEVVMLARQVIPETQEHGTESLEIALTYQACDDRSCLPPVTTNASLEIAIGPGGELASSVPALAATTGSPATARRPKPSASLAIMLVLGLLGGLILNAMPCVLPVLSLKAFGLVKAAGQGRSQVVSGALATSAGILFSFWALALLAVMARSGGAAVGWGIQFQEPAFVAALTVVVILFCLNLWGLFEVPLPRRLASAAGAASGQGFAGHFTSGLFATLMATPCSAPFLGTAVGFALAQEATVIFAVFTAVGLGMALPYLALAAAPQAANWLPKPGSWMNHVRIVMGFLLAGAAVWLLYVLAAQISSERVAFFQVTLLALALFVWWHQTARESTWNRRIALLAAVGTVLLSVFLAASAPMGEGREVSGSATLIDWTRFDRESAETLEQSGTLVFVDVTADWCFTCKVNERLALETEDVAAAFERHGVVAMKADWTNRSDPIAQFLADHGRYGIPFYVLYRPGQEPHVFGELITREEIVEVVEAAAIEAGTLLLSF